ncbi:MAG TPA: CHRD domain-containing protein [Chitinophagaceae bacterium]|nr:CHRD domain-containing protein [Chitinophagaceae bacterium]
MKWIKLTAFNLIFFALVIHLSSCEREFERQKVYLYQKLGVVLSGAQETPANASTALGLMDIFYNKDTKTLTYTVKWSGLTGAVTAMHIHGTAPIGFQASATPYQVISPTGLGATGTKSGSIVVDNISIKENDLLDGFYYLHIHTAAFPGTTAAHTAEIRGQIKF